MTTRLNDLACPDWPVQTQHPSCKLQHPMQVTPPVACCTLQQLFQLVSFCYTNQDPSIGKYAVAAAQRCRGGPADCTNARPPFSPGTAALDSNSAAAQNVSRPPNSAAAQTASPTPNPVTVSSSSGSSGLNFSELIQPVTSLFG